MYDIIPIKSREAFTVICVSITLMGQPQFGHDIALSDISFPHSGQLIKAIKIPPV